MNDKKHPRNLFRGILFLAVAALTACGSGSGASSGTTKTTQTTPTITWATPAAIVYGTVLSVTQLNATASVSGSFSYAPPVGAVPPAGTQTLTVRFTPTDTVDYTSAQSKVSLVVTKATPTIAWAAPASIVYGTALSATQLNASASTPGTIVYSPSAGATLHAGTQTLSASFTPIDAADYDTAHASVPLVIAKATPSIAWATPGSIDSGSAVTSAQLNASSAVAGSFTYLPAAGTTQTVPGALTLQTVLNPTDTSDYLSATATVQLTVSRLAGTPSYRWTSVTINVGGFTDGLYFHPKQQGLLYAKMDIADAYRFNTTTGNGSHCSIGSIILGAVTSIPITMPLRPWPSTRQIQNGFFSRSVSARGVRTETCSFHKTRATPSRPSPCPSPFRPIQMAAKPASGWRSIRICRVGSISAR